MGADLPIDTARLRLRAFEPSDLDAIASYHLLPDAQRYLPLTVRSRAECAAVLETMRRNKGLHRPGDTLFVAISLLGHSRAVVGQAALRWADATAGQAEVSMVLSRAHRGQGFGSEALSAILGLGFERMRFHRIYARCDARNDAAARLLRRGGMRLEAHYREHALFRGEWDEELHFAMLDREWVRAHPSVVDSEALDASAHRVA